MQFLTMKNVMIKHLGFNTASGMDCMQFRSRENSRGRGVVFQYRKRYGLHAIKAELCPVVHPPSFNTASGMDCMQWDHSKRLPRLSLSWFQYRKRYGLHAILSPRTLENSEPRNRFSSTPSLFALFPKPRGTFLSQKAVQKGCKARYTKETFVHEENLKLMTSFRKSRTSL